MTNITIGFIGAGNMAASIVGGLLAEGHAPERIWLNDIAASRLDELEQQFKVNTSLNYSDFVAQCDVIVLAVKPQNMEEVCQALQTALPTPLPLIISIAAGVTVSRLQSWLGAAPVVRAMPNTPALVQTGATGLYASTEVTAEQHQQAEQLLNSVGISVWLSDEAQMDAVTAVSGSGPAYFFLLMEHMIASGQALGLDESTARQLVLQTALGAATLASNSEEPPSVLRERVTSPGGTTAAALNTFMQGGLDTLVADALAAAKRRSEELA